jgi:predicted RNase H-like nuclease (RuvC/YqgF family)
MLHIFRDNEVEELKKELKRAREEIKRLKKKRKKVAPDLF